MSKLNQRAQSYCLQSGKPEEKQFNIQFRNSILLGDPVSVGSDNQVSLNTGSCLGPYGFAVCTTFHSQSLNYSFLIGVGLRNVMYKSVQNSDFLWVAHRKQSHRRKETFCHSQGLYRWKLLCLCPFFYSQVRNSNIESSENKLHESLLQTSYNHCIGLLQMTDSISILADVFRLNLTSFAEKVQKEPLLPLLSAISLCRPLFHQAFLKTVM